MYIVVNSSVKMSVGKKVAQSCHVASQVTERMLRTAKQEWEEYKAGGTTKIACKATEEELRKFIELYGQNDRIWCEFVCDAGRTQVEPGTLTAIAFRPLREDETPAILKSLSLL